MNRRPADQWRSMALAWLGAALAGALVVALAVGLRLSVLNGHFGQGLFYLFLFEVRANLERFVPFAFWIATGLLVATSMAARLTRRWSGLVVGLGVVSGALALPLALGWSATGADVGADPRGTSVNQALWGLRQILRGQTLAVWVAVGLVTACLFAWLYRHRSVSEQRAKWTWALLIAAPIALVLGATEIRQATARTPERHNVVLIVLDTVAAAHLATYGYERVTTPELDALARQGVVFRNSFSVAPWTLPSHSSMFTGLYPASHGATQENLTLDAGFATVAERLRDQGYRTFAAVNSGVLSAQSGAAQGFSSYLEMQRNAMRRTYRNRGAHPTNLAVSEFLDSLQGDDRFFMFLNYIEAHALYQPTRKSAARFLPPEWSWRRATGIQHRWSGHYLGDMSLEDQELEVLADLYDGELADLSRTIGSLMESLKSRGLDRNTLVILTSDHGENIGDHGHMDHVFSLYDSLLRVPLILLGPGVSPGVERFDTTSSVDVFSTILGATGTEVPLARNHGRDLLAAGGTEAPAEEIAEYYYPLQALSVLARKPNASEPGLARLEPYMRRLRSIRSDGWKLIWGSDGQHELYQVSIDPQETRDVIAANPERARQLEKRLFRKLSQLAGRTIHPGTEPLPEPGTVKGFENVDEETMRQLRALGYLGPSPSDE